jgi:predicted dehydrogenase
MRFALVGEHSDGLNMARALSASGRFEWQSYDGLPQARAFIQKLQLEARAVPDLEEILADPAVELVIVAGAPNDRAAQLRRCLQAERHVLCVHPPDDSPDTAYEAAMIQGDTHCLLLPLLPDSLHPAVQRLAKLMAQGAIGALRLIEIERADRGSVLLGAGTSGFKPSIPGWDLLRLLGGEIVEVSGFAEKEELDGETPLLLSGRFQQGGVFQANFLPNSPEESHMIRVTGTTGQAELHQVGTIADPVRLVSQTGPEERWEGWDPWPALVDVLEAALSAGNPEALNLISWPSEIRNLELDDAARRSVKRRRASTLEYPEATEEVGFKGTMTLFGCAILWAILFLLILSRWVPWMGWLIVPILGVFLGLQLLRWVLPRERNS